VELLLRLESFALPAAHRLVSARLETAAPRRGRGALQTRVELGPLNAMELNRWFRRFDGAGDDYVIKSGLASSWVTATQ